MRVLAIDYGSKRVGLAVSDPLGITAQGLESLPYKGDENTALAIAQIVKEREVRAIVIGMPINMNGTLGPQAEKIKQFASLLEAKCGLLVTTWDERLTSLQAEKMMIDSGLSRDRRKDESDRIAATLILQGFLQWQRNQKHDS